MFSLKQIESMSRECIKLARHFGDRQNSESKLTAREAEALVTCLLNAGNTMEHIARDMAVRTPEIPEAVPVSDTPPPSAGT